MRGFFITELSYTEENSGYDTLKNLLGDRQSFFAKFIPTPAWPVFVILGGFLGFVTPDNSGWIEASIANPSIVLFLIALALADTGGGSTVTLEARHSSENFFERNKDQLLLSAISALLGAVAALAIQMF